MKESIKHLDSTIVNLLQERERFIGAIKQSNKSQGDLGTSSLFTTPFAVDKFISIDAYEEFASGYSIGYEWEKKPRICIKQEYKTDVLLSPPDHHFTFSIDVADHAHSKWITLERGIGSYSMRDKLTINLSIKAKATMEGKLHLSFTLPLEGKEPIHVPLDTMTLKGGDDYNSMVISTEVDLSTYEVTGDESDISPRVTLFFPANTNSIYTLSFFTVLVASES